MPISLRAVATSLVVYLLAGSPDAQPKQTSHSNMAVRLPILQSVYPIGTRELLSIHPRPGSLGPVVRWKRSSLLSR